MFNLKKIYIYKYIFYQDYLSTQKILLDQINISYQLKNLSKNINCWRKIKMKKEEERK